MSIYDLCEVAVVHCAPEMHETLTKSNTRQPRRSYELRRSQTSQAQIRSRGEISGLLVACRLIGPLAAGRREVPCEVCTVSCEVLGFPPASPSLFFAGSLPTSLAGWLAFVYACSVPLC